MRLIEQTTENRFQTIGANTNKLFLSPVTTQKERETQVTRINRDELDFYFGPLGFGW